MEGTKCKTLKQCTLKNAVKKIISRIDAIKLFQYKCTYLVVFLYNFIFYFFYTLRKSSIFNEFTIFTSQQNSTLIRN